MGGAATIALSTYGEGVADDEAGVWPAAGRTLLAELATSRDRFGLVASASAEATDDLVGRLEADLGLPVVRLGIALAEKVETPSAGEIESTCGGAAVIADIEVLMSPWLHVSPLSFLARLGRHRPIIGVWPGTITGGRATYSAPSRPDHQDVALRDVLILRPKPTRFPDEMPFTIERILP